MSEAVSELSKTALARRYESMRASLRRVREETKTAARLATGGVLAAAGGGAAGYMSVQANLQTVPGTEIPLAPAIGAGLLLGCALDMFDGANDNVASFAGGMLAFYAGQQGQRAALAAKK